VTYFPDPWAIQVEPVFGCTRLCRFCGLRSVKPDKPKFMSIELAYKISKELGEWFEKKRVEFALRGEPTLHPQITDIISTFRDNFPKGQFLIATNGDIIKNNGELVDKLFASGLNILLIDIYDDNYSWWKEYVRTFGIRYYEFYRDGMNPYRYHGFKKKFIVLMDSVARNKRKHIVRYLNNQAGNVFAPELGLAPLIRPKKQRCQIPFREISIFYDGTVPICCMDYREECVLGKFPDQSLKDIWYGDNAYLVRCHLYDKRRDLITPCKRCDYVGKKVGLLPNPREYGGDDG